MLANSFFLRLKDRRSAIRLGRKKSFFTQSPQARAAWKGQKRKKLRYILAAPVSGIIWEGEGPRVDLIFNKAHHVHHIRRRVGKHPPVALLPRSPYDIGDDPTQSPLLVLRIVGDVVKPPSIEVTVHRGSSRRDWEIIRL